MLSSFRKKLVLLSAICVISFSSVAFSESEKKQIDEQIGQYLQDNPESVYGALMSLKQKQAIAQQEALEKAIRDKKEEFFANKVSPVLGNPKGTITAVEFQDYQCGHCKQMYHTIEKMVKANPKDLRVIVKEMPIFGKVSEYAARAALAAGKQGKFEQMHSALLNYEPSGKKRHGIREKDIDKMAKNIGLDVDKWKKDMHNGAFNKELKDVKRLAQTIGLKGTPYFIFADKAGKQIMTVPGGLPEDNFQATIDVLSGKADDFGQAMKKITDARKDAKKSKDTKKAAAKDSKSANKDAKKKVKKSEKKDTPKASKHEAKKADKKAAKA